MRELKINLVRCCSGMPRGVLGCVGREDGLCPTHGSRQGIRCRQGDRQSPASEEQELVERELRVWGHQVRVADPGEQPRRHLGNLVKRNAMGAAQPGDHKRAACSPAGVSSQCSFPMGTGSFLRRAGHFLSWLGGCKMFPERWRQGRASLAQLQDALTTGQHLPRGWRRGPGSDTVPHRCGRAMSAGRWQDGSPARDLARVLRKALWCLGFLASQGDVPSPG